MRIEGDCGSVRVIRSTGDIAMYADRARTTSMQENIRRRMFTLHKHVRLLAIVLANIKDKGNVLCEGFTPKGKALEEKVNEEGPGRLMILSLWSP